MKRKNDYKSQVEFKKNAAEILKKTFGKNLKLLREKKDLSQEAMAFVTGLSRSYYAEIETGARNPSLINISKILAATDTSFEKLLPLSEVKKQIK